MVGNSVVTWLWGGFSVDNPTLNRFYSLHYLLPFAIFGVVFLHVAALHVSGSNNPLGIDPKSDKDTVPFHPYYTAKDCFGLSIFLIIYALIIFYAPNMLGDPDNYIPANPMATPARISSRNEYFLLLSTPCCVPSSGTFIFPSPMSSLLSSKLGGVIILMFGSIALLFA